MALDPPWRLDPHERIVEVGWGGVIAALQFRSAWGGGAGGPSGYSVALPQLGAPIPIERLAVHAGSYQAEETHVGPPITTTTTTYDFVVTFSSGNISGNGGGIITVISDGTHTFWSSNGGAAGSGDIGAAEVYYLSIGWDTFSATQTGSSSSTSPGPTTKSGEHNDVWLFNLRLLQQFFNDPSLTALHILVATGNPPTPVEGAGAVSYDWTSIIETFKGASLNSFLLDDHALPVHWKNHFTARQDTGHDNTTLRYAINFKTLEIGTF